MPREPVWGGQGAAGVSGVAAYWLGAEAAVGFAPNTDAGREDYTFAFHDSEEIGPVMLKRVAKRTGLMPEDL